MIKSGLTTLLILLLAPVLHAHDSPEHDIEKYTRILAKSPQSATIHYRRGLSYQELGKLKLARADFQAASKLDPAVRAHRIALTRVQLQLGEAQNALNTARALVSTSKTPSERAQGHIFSAEALTLAGQHSQSISEIKKALASQPNGEIEWFLLRSENQLALGRHPQRITDLVSAQKIHHGNPVLYSHYVDALLDGKQFRAALKETTSELADRRWKSSWEIKHARALIGLNQPQQARASLHSALTEISQRLNPKRPDPLLLADQAHAYHLLGNHQAARKALTLLKQHHPPRWITSRLESLIK